VLISTIGRKVVVYQRSAECVIHDEIAGLEPKIATIRKVYAEPLRCSASYAKRSLTLSARQCYVHHMCALLCFAALL
jgi:hypothetical protein